MSISDHIIILSVSIFHHYCLTKTSDLTFIWCYNVWIEYCNMVVITFVHVPSCHDNIRACALTVFVPYPLCKYILMLSFSYWWLWGISVIISYHLLFTDHVRIWLIHFWLSFLYHHTVSYNFSSYLKALFIVPSSFFTLGVIFYLFDPTVTKFSTVKVFHKVDFIASFPVSEPLLMDQYFEHPYGSKYKQQCSLKML